MEKPDIEFIFSKELFPYEQAFEFMNKRAASIAAGFEKEIIWFLEHPLTFTAGTSASSSEIKNDSIKVFQTNRGGKHTLHLPGQRVIYLLLNLKKRAKDKLPDVRAYVKTLEQIIINSLSFFNIKGERKEGRIGVWVNNPATNAEEKIAAIGIRFSKGVTLHGFAVNVCNDLIPFSQIVPCGIEGYNICSLQSLGKDISMQTFDKILLKEIQKEFC